MALPIGTHAPGFYTGYGVKTMRGIIEEGRLDEAKQQMVIAVKAVQDEAICSPTPR